MRNRVDRVFVRGGYFLVNIDLFFIIVYNFFDVLSLYPEIGLGRGQAARRRTLDPVFGGSNPPAPANLFGPFLGAFSSVGRALPLQGRGRRFKPVNAHHIFISGWSSSVAEHPPCKRVVVSSNLTSSSTRRACSSVG